MSVEQGEFRIIAGEPPVYNPKTRNQFTSTDYSIVDVAGNTVVWGSFQDESRVGEVLYSVVWNAPVTIDQFLERMGWTIDALRTSEVASQADPEIAPGYMVQYGKRRRRNIPSEQPTSESFRKRFPDFPNQGVRFVRVDTPWVDFIFHDRGQFQPNKPPQIGIITAINAPDQLADFVLNNLATEVPRPLVTILLGKLGSLVRTRMSEFSSIP